MSVPGYLQDASGLGQPFQTVIAQPAIGVSNISTIVPSGQIWKIQSILTSLRTDFDTGSRRLLLRALDSTLDSLFSLAPIYIQVNDENVNYCWTIGVSPKVTLFPTFNDLIECELPEFYLLPGESIAIDCDNMMPDDQFGSCYITYLIYESIGF